MSRDIDNITKRKKSEKTLTEQGKYSSKYALTELMICGECGTPYRRCTWNVHGQKQIVWRCISRLDHGSKYCHESPTMHEDKLHGAIIHAINDYFECDEDVAKLLKDGTESVLCGLSGDEIKRVEQQLRDIDKARSDLIGLITSGAAEEDSLDTEFARLYEAEADLNEKLASLKAQNRVSAKERKQAQAAQNECKRADFKLTEFDDILIRKLIECVKVLSKAEIEIYFKGGYAVRAEVEK